jgi:hypothetical protein
MHFLQMGFFDAFNNKKEEDFEPIRAVQPVKGQVLITFMPSGAQVNAKPGAPVAFFFQGFITNSSMALIPRRRAHWRRCTTSGHQCAIRLQGGRLRDLRVYHEATHGAYSFSDTVRAPQNAKNTADVKCRLGKPRIHCANRASPTSSASAPRRCPRPTWTRRTGDSREVERRRKEECGIEARNVEWRRARCTWEVKGATQMLLCERKVYHRL